MKQDKVKQELEKIRKKHKGILRPEDVVEFAKNPGTALHSKFCWDDSEAARQFRLNQARDVIRLCLTVHGPAKEEVRAYVSIMEDRSKSGGGYRLLDDVLSSEQMRARLVRDVYNEFRRVQAKHRVYSELQPIYDAIETVGKQLPARTFAAATA